MPGHAHETPGRPNKKSGAQLGTSHRGRGSLKGNQARNILRQKAAAPPRKMVEVFSGKGNLSYYAATQGIEVSSYDGGISATDTPKLSTAASAIKVWPKRWCKTLVAPMH